MESWVSVWNVMDFGAKGDKKEREDSAIQKAIDACYKAGGGTVYLPPGDYLSGAIYMRSNVALHIEAGATLWASVNKEDYPIVRELQKTHQFKDIGADSALIIGKDLHDIAIIGRGKINGQGFTKVPIPSSCVCDGPHICNFSFRPEMIFLFSCRNVIIKDIIFEYASVYTIHPFRCENINIRGITILNNKERWHTDGIDIDCSRNVHISDCHIVTGDDCIIMKGNAEYPCENITVTNCTMETPDSALKLGTESIGDFRHITFNNCIITAAGTGIAFYVKDGGTMEDVIFSNITIKTDPIAWSEYPILMKIEKRHPESKLGKIRNIIIRDLIIDTRGRCSIEGNEESPIENLTIENVKINVIGYENSSQTMKPLGGTSSEENFITKYDNIPSYFIVAHTKDLTVKNVQLNFQTKEPLENRFAISGNHLKGFELDGFRGRQTLPGEFPVIKLDNCQDVYLHGSFLPEGVSTFLNLSGKETARIVFMNNDLSRAKKVLEKNSNVKNEAVYQEANKLPE